MTYKQQDLHGLWDFLKGYSSLYGEIYLGLKPVSFNASMNIFSQANLDKHHEAFPDMEFTVTQDIGAALTLLQDKDIRTHHLSCAADTGYAGNTALCIHYREDGILKGVTLPGINYIGKGVPVRTLIKNYIPFFGQEKENWCGPAVVKMAIADYGFDFSQEDLSKRLLKHEKGHTSKINMRTFLDELGLVCHEYAEEGAHGNLTILSHNHLEHLLYAIADDKPVIVNITQPSGDGHLIIPHAYDEKSLVVHDPGKGPNTIMSFDEFMPAWISGNKKWKKWFMAFD